MALAKRVMRRGSVFTGHKLTVTASAGDHALDITFTKGTALSGITVIPDKYDGDDYFKIEHLNSSDEVIKTHATTIYNLGANSAIEFDFIALELFESNEKLRITYVSANSVPMIVHALVEKIDSAKD